MPLLLEGAKFKSSGEKRKATLELVLVLKGSMCSDPPKGFKDSWLLMKEDVTIETVELEASLPMKQVQIFAVPDIKKANMTINGVDIQDFKLERVKGAKGIQLKFKAHFEYQDDLEAAVWMLTNLGTSFFWELEDQQEELGLKDVAETPTKAKVRKAMQGTLPTDKVQ